MNNAAIMNASGNLVCLGDTPCEVVSATRMVRFDQPGVMFRLTPLRGNLISTFQTFVPDDQSKKRGLLGRLASEEDWKAYFEVKQRWGDVRFPYAMTVHKSQGSTLEHVFVDVTNFNKCRDFPTYRRLLYVAASRASVHLHLLGEPK